MWICGPDLCARQFGGGVEFRPPPVIHHMPHSGVLAAASSHTKMVTQAAASGHPQVSAIAEKALAEKAEAEKAIAQKKEKEKKCPPAQVHHNQIFFGKDGAKCHWDDIQRANAVANAISNDKYKDNPILGMLIELFGPDIDDKYKAASPIVAALLVYLGDKNIAGFKKIDPSCSWDNIKGLYADVEKHLNQIIELDRASIFKKFRVEAKFLTHSFSLNTFAGILLNRARKRVIGEERTGWKLFEYNLYKLISKNGYPVCSPVMPEEPDYHKINGYRLVHVNEKGCFNENGFWYQWKSADPQPKDVPLGHIKWGDMGIQFDWFKKY